MNYTPSLRRQVPFAAKKSSWNVRFLLTAYCGRSGSVLPSLVVAFGHLVMGPACGPARKVMWVWISSCVGWFGTSKTGSRSQRLRLPE